jgi:hypothetical protein
VYRGLHTARSKKALGQTVSADYFSVDEYDPFAGRTRHAGALAAPFQPRERVQRQAKASATAWEPDTDRLSTVRRVFELSAAGTTDQEVAAEVGLPLFTVRGILTCISAVSAMVAPPIGPPWWTRPWRGGHATGGLPVPPTPGGAQPPGARTR